MCRPWLFQRELRTAPFTYLTERRIARAVALLDQTGKPIEEVAFAPPLEGVDGVMTAVYGAHLHDCVAGHPLKQQKPGRS
ncbi:hypothetical protein [Paracoccus sp. (in: a-proteobacteria)]|uniref:hypothetical protein n=1 Tax=Paracoccus sp. TaxID=267 RepID=UPI0028B01ABC|nr:hypothetical protein [Paracoccus sp. (in: a-proteobacteria)]